jgi:hypothetical protein
MKKWSFTFALAFSSHLLMAEGITGSKILMYSIIGLLIFLVIAALMLVADNFMNLEAYKQGIDIKTQNFSAVPGYDDFTRPHQRDQDEQQSNGGDSH